MATKNTNINQNKIIIEIPKPIRRKSTPRPKKTLAQAEEELNDLEKKDKQYQQGNYGQGLSGINPNIKISFNPSLYGFNKTPMDATQPQQAEQQAEPQAEPQTEPLKQEEEQTTQQAEPTEQQFGAFRSNSMDNRSGFNDIRTGFSQSYRAPQFNRQDFQSRMNQEIPVAEPIDEGYMAESDKKPSKAKMSKVPKELEARVNSYLDSERQYLAEKQAEKQAQNKKSKGRPAGQPNRPKENIEAEKQAKEERKKEREDRRKANEEARLKKEKANEESLRKAREISAEALKQKKMKEQEEAQQQYEKIKEQSKVKQEKADKKKEKEERKGMKAEDTKPKKGLRTINLEL
jgi:hypothetical protein